MLYRIGIILLFLGVSMAESENLLVPVAMAMTGAALLLIASRREEAKDEDLYL